MERIKTQRQIVSRSLVVSMAPASELFSQYADGGKINSLLRFYVGKKGSSGNDERYTLLGGKMNQDESWEETTQREVGEEIGARFFGIPNQTVIGKWTYSSAKSGERDVILTYNPILPQKEIIVGDPKIQNVEILNLEELKSLFENGQLHGVPIEGHLTKSPQDAIRIEKSDTLKKNMALDKATFWMQHIESYLIEKLNSKKYASAEEFQEEYDYLLGRLMRKGLDVAMTKRNLKIESVPKGKPEIIQALDSGFLGKDVLYYLPDIAVKGTEWSGLEHAPESTKEFINFLNEIFDGFLEEQKMSREEYRLFLLNQDINMQHKSGIISELDKFFIVKLHETFPDLNDNDFNQVHSLVQEFYKQISNELKVADLQLTDGLYQEDKKINEVNNASFGALLSLFLGFEMKENEPQISELIRFESGRELLLLMKGIIGYKHFLEETQSVKQGLFQNAINTFFGRVRGKSFNLQILPNKSMVLRNRGRKDLELIIDEKEIKTFSSFLRKSFEVPSGEINDFHNVNVILLNKKGQTAIDSAFELQTDFKQFLRQEYPDITLIEEDEKTYGIPRYEEEVLGNRTHQYINYKLRPGSQGDKMVRSKIILEMKNETLELVVYPFFSIQEGDGQFWGWLEKIADNTNYVVRRMLTGQNGSPSFHDLLYPAYFYPSNYHHKLRSTYHN